jgi:hypothetical protein
VATLEGLQADEELRARVRSYVDGEIERSKREDTGAGEVEEGVKVSLSVPIGSGS